MSYFTYIDGDDTYFGMYQSNECFYQLFLSIFINVISAWKGFQHLFLNEKVFPNENPT